jgi:hypothetical protein
MLKKLRIFFDFFKKDPWLLSALGLFSVLAWWHFWKQGVINFDEAYFIVVVRTFSDIAKGLLFHPTSFFSGSLLSDLAADYGNVYTAARPSYILASSLLSFFIPATVASRLVSLASGYLLIVFFYRLLGFYVKDPRIKGVLTFLPAVSPLLLVYSRLGLSQVFSAAFLAVSTYYLISYYRSGSFSDIRKFSISTAILFMSHYNVIFLVFFLLFYGVLALRRHRAGIKNYFSFVLYFLAFPLAWEVITQIAVAIAGNRLGGGQKLLSYSGEFLTQLTKAQVSEEAPFGQFLYYPNLVFSTEGAFMALFMFLGLLLLLWRLKRFEYQVVAIPLLFSLLLFWAAPLKFPRNLISVWPSLYLAAALAIDFLSSRLAKAWKFDKRFYLLVAVMFLALWPHLSKYPDYLIIDTGNAQVAKYIKDNYSSDEVIILSWSTAIWRALLPGYVAEQLAEPEEWRRKLQERPSILLIDDYFTGILDPGREDYFSGNDLVFERKTDIFQSRPVIMDMIYKSPEALEMVFKNNQDSRIVVYEHIDR